MVPATIASAWLPDSTRLLTSQVAVRIVSIRTEQFIFRGVVVLFFRQYNNIPLDFPFCSRKVPILFLFYSRFVPDLFPLFRHRPQS